MDKLNNKGVQVIKLEEVKIDPERLVSEPDCDRLNIIATRNLVLFPGVTVHFELGREAAQELARRADHAAFPIGIVCQINPDDDSPAVTTGLYKYGVFADVLSVHDIDGRTPIAIVRARGRFRILGAAKPDENGQRGQWMARVKPVADVIPADTERYGITLGIIAEIANDIFQKTGDPQHIATDVRNTSDGEQIINMLATHLPIENAEKIALLSRNKIEDRALGLITQMSLFRDRLKLTEEIAERAKRTMDENQRNAFLQNQMDAIRETLYGSEDDEIDALVRRAEESGMPDRVFETFKKESEKMRRYNPSSPDYSVQYSYLDTLASLPWNKRTPVTSDIVAAENILEEDHYGLERVKQRILEQLAVLFHNPGERGTILCLVGPPGVGKTSVGKSVARALGRKYERVSFGGLHDESEIRGHRRTYIGAMPGRIIDAIKRVGVMNPVILLDEVDKIGQDYKGDPAAALLEVLDPEQNCHFHDNYIDVDFDLSGVLFIATANTLGTIPRPLLDRMEVIEINGYLAEEKIEIARRHLIPRALAAHKLTEDDLQISDSALSAIISDYTSESGVRELEKKISALARKSVLHKLRGESFPKPVEAADLYGLLGLAPRTADKYEGNDIAGVVTGLAWTEVGGEILLAEASLSPAKEGMLAVTGNLGNVMKESASIAYQWVKAHADNIGVDRNVLDTHAVHVHFPEGAIPKDGPSAGITIVTAIVSALRRKRVAPRIAMTGEVTLRGRVLPVGGIREKILAAKRAGITDIVMSERNRRDIEDMPAAYRDGLSFHYVDTVNQVLALAVTDEDPA